MITSKSFKFLQLTLFVYYFNIEQISKIVVLRNSITILNKNMKYVKSINLSLHSEFKK